MESRVTSTQHPQRSASVYKRVTKARLQLSLAETIVATVSLRIQCTLLRPMKCTTQLRMMLFVATAAHLYLPVTKVLCFFTEIVVVYRGTPIMEAGLHFVTVLASGIRDPDSKPYIIILVASGFFSKSRPDKARMGVSKFFVKILRGVWGDFVWSLCEMKRSTTVFFSFVISA